MKKYKEKLLAIGFSMAIIMVCNSQNQYLKYYTGLSMTSHPKTDNINPVLEKTASGTIQDTLWYFYNKHYYCNPVPANNNFNYIITGPATATAFGHCGVVFLNTGTITVSGFEGVVGRKSSSPSASIPIRFYLCNVNGNNLPVFPPIDSASANVFGNVTQYPGCNLLSPKTVTSNFAILFKNASNVSGDSVFLLMNNALTHTSTSTNNNAKYGEGLSVVRYGGNFLKTTNIFSPGSDYEFLIAPRVSYNIEASVAISSSVLCTNAASTFTNTSNFYAGHRQYNLNKFYNHWRPFGNSATTSSIKPDSVFNWDFDDGTFIYTSGQGTASNAYASPGIFNASLTIKHQKMSAYHNYNSTDLPNKLEDAYLFALKASDCNATGLATMLPGKNYNFFPNPMTDGKTTLYGLSGNTHIIVTDLAGRLINNEVTSGESVSIDLSGQRSGFYLIKVISTDSQEKIIKVIR